MFGMAMDVCCMAMVGACEKFRKTEMKLQDSFAFYIRDKDSDQIRHPLD